MEIADSNFSHVTGSNAVRFWGSHRDGQPRSRPDRDRPRPTDFGPSRTEPIISVRFGPLGFQDRLVRSIYIPWTDWSGPGPPPIGPTDWSDRLDRSFCS